MSESLYDLSNELAVINDEIIDAEGVISEELERRLDDCGLAFNQKVEGVVRWTKNLEGKEAALDAEIARLQNRKKAATNLRGRLKYYLLMCMTAADKTKVEFDLVTIAVQRNPPSCEITSPESVPAAYTTTRTEIVIDKKRVLDDLKAGLKVEGARISETTYHIHIR